MWCVLSTRRSSFGHAAGEPHCSQHQSHMEGPSHTSHLTVCWCYVWVYTAHLKALLLPSLAPDVRAHKRGPSRLHHQIQGVRRTAWNVATPERGRHPGGGEHHSEQPQALHQIRRAGPGQNWRRGRTSFHGAALLHPGWAWVNEIRWRDHTSYTGSQGVCFFPHFKATQLPLLLLRGYTDQQIPTTWKHLPLQHLWLLPQCGEMTTWQPGWPLVGLHMLFFWLLSDTVSLFQ